MRKASTSLLEQGTQTPSPAPDLIPAQTKNQPRTHTGIGTANGGTSGRLFELERKTDERGCFCALEVPEGICRARSKLQIGSIQRFL